MLDSMGFDGAGLVEAMYLMLMAAIVWLVLVIWSLSGIVRFWNARTRRGQNSFFISVVLFTVLVSPLVIFWIATHHT
jgi:hypothetical protein